MKKATIFAAFAATACLASAQVLQSIPAQAPAYAAEEEGASMEFGYCGEMSTYIGWGNAAEATTLQSTFLKVLKTTTTSTTKNANSSLNNGMKSLLTKRILSMATNSLSVSKAPRHQ